MTTIPRARGDRPSEGRHPRARHDDRSRRQRHASPASTTSPTASSTSSRRRSCCSPASPTRTRGCCCCRSRTAFPNGLSNNHKQVGRHYFSHHQGAPVSALFPFNLDSWYGLPAQGVAVDNWADDNFDHAGLDFIGGANLWAMSDRRPIAAAGMNTFGRAPGWGSQWKAFIKENADRSHSSYIQKTTLPYEDNYPRSRSGGEGSARLSGLPHHRASSRTTSGRSPPSRRTRWSSGIAEAGAIAVQRAPVGGAMGVSTARLRRHPHGRQPRDQRRQPLGFSHEVPNLGVLGASVMGTSGARNPTLTAQALAWRTAEHLVKNWKRDQRQLSRDQAWRTCGSEPAACRCRLAGEGLVEDVADRLLLLSWPPSSWRPSSWFPPSSFAAFFFAI